MDLGVSVVTALTFRHTIDDPTRFQSQCDSDYREGERRQRGDVTLDEAAAASSVSPSTVRRLIKDSQIAANQLCKGAPWIIKPPTWIAAT